MDIKKLEEYWERLKKQPLRTFFYIIIAISLFAGMCYLQGYMSEKGRRMAVVLKEMAKIEKEQSKELSKNFPKGYQLFTILDEKIIPSKFSDKDININWESAKILDINKKNVTIQLPDAKLSGNNILIGNKVTIKNEVGSSSSGAIKIGNWSSSVKILEANNRGIIAVVGYSKE